MQEDGSELVEERPGRHEVPGVHDDGRQDDGEEELRVELDDLVLVAAEVRDYSQRDADDDQKATLRTQPLQSLAGVETCRTSH